MFFKGSAIALTLLALVLVATATGSEDKRLVRNRRVEEEAGSGRGGNKLKARLQEDFNPPQPAPIGTHNQGGWDKDGNLIVSSNEIDSQPAASNQEQKQQEYACGRAQANKRYKNSHRAKYRPIEMIRMPKIIGGDMASPGEFPWTASIKLNEQPICGGSLIDKSWILTAAHCVVGYNPKNLTVRLGAYRIKDLTELHTFETPVSMFIVHEDYSIPRLFSNDIALVKLQEPVEYSDYIIPICLPTEDQVTTSTSNVIVNDYSKEQHSNHYDRGSQIAGDFNELSQHVYYGLPWTTGKRFDSIKLSRLPISKELLKEIQSVGSGVMASLSLGLQQGDLVHMANDLTQSSISNEQAGSVPINSVPVDDNSSRGILTSFLNKVIRTSTEEEDAEDDPTKYSGLSGTVVGWGWVRELDEEDGNGGSSNNNKGYSSITLQKVKLPILRNNVCEAWFQSQSKKITLLPSQFCAGFNSGGKDACRGDSGGPMIIEDSSDTGRYKLIGIVSAGIGCARRSLPGLYTRVASFIPWINSQMSRY